MYCPPRLLRRYVSFPCRCFRPFANIRSRLSTSKHFGELTWKVLHPTNSWNDAVVQYIDESRFDIDMAYVDDIR